MATMAILRARHSAKRDASSPASHKEPSASTATFYDEADSYAVNEVWASEPSTTAGVLAHCAPGTGFVALHSRVSTRMKGKEPPDKGTNTGNIHLVTHVL